MIKKKKENPSLRVIALLGPKSVKDDIYNYENSQSLAYPYELVLLSF